MCARHVYLLRASAPFSVRGREEVIVNLNLRKIPCACGGAIAGRVRDGARPVKRAVVLVLSWNFRPVAHALTDESGSYCMRGLRPGLYFAVASAPGYAASGVKAAVVRAKRTSHLSFELKKCIERSRGTIYGRIIDTRNANPVGGAAVCLSPRGLRPPFCAVANEQGQYFIYGLPPGEWRVVARKRGYAPSRPLSIRVGEGSRFRIDIRLRRAAGQAEE